MKKRNRMMIIMLIMCIIMIAATLCSCNVKPPSDGNDNDVNNEWIIQQQPTCTDAGLKYRINKNGTREEEPIPALGHSYGEWQQTVAPTTTSEGSQKRTCSRCGNEETQTLSALVDGTNGLEYTYWPTYDTYYITGSGTAVNESKLIIPSKYMGKTVVYVYKNSLTNMPNLETVEFSQDSKITAIYENAFANCPKLKTVNIPASVTNLSGSFAPNCPSLESVVVNSENKTYSSLDGVLYNKDKNQIFFYPPAKTGKFVVPNTIKTFQDTTAFALANGFGITEFDVENEDSNFSVEDGVLYKKGSYAYLQAYPHAKKSSTFTVNTDIKGISKYAFYNNNSLTDLIISNSRSGLIVDTYAISNTLIKHISFECDVFDINDYALYNNSELSSVSFNGGNNSSKCKLGSYSFMNCKALKTITLPANLNLSIGPGSMYDPFFGCENLEHIDIQQAENTKYKSFDGVLYDKSGETLFFIPGAKKDLSFEKTLKTLSTLSMKLSNDKYLNLAYDYDENGLKYYKNWLIAAQVNKPDIVVKEGTIGIAPIAFGRQTTYNSITLPASVKYISPAAFSQTKVTNFIYSNNFEYISDHAFSEFNYSGKIDLGTPSYVGGWAFNSAKVSEIIIGYKNNNANATIAEKAFYSSNIKKLYLGQYIEFVGDKACYVKTLSDLYVANQTLCENKSLFYNNKCYAFYLQRIWLSDNITLSDTVKENLQSRPFLMTNKGNTCTVQNIAYYCYEK